MAAPTSLLDRNGELDALGGVLDAARDGRGSIVVLEGAAGSGKSALVAAAGEHARGAGLHVLTARGGELERDFPFGVIRQLYEHEVLSSPAERRVALLAGSAAPAAWALGIGDGSPGVHASGFAVVHAIYWLTAYAAGDAPLALVVDDAHWSDVSSLRALDYLARRVDDTGVCLIVALRPDEPGAPADLVDGLRSMPDALRLAPGPLRPESVARLVRERFPDAGDELCGACHEVTGGNPLYLQELFRALRNGAEAPHSERVLRASVRSLGDRVLRRVERVAAGGPALSRAAAVLGDGARLSTAAALAELSEQHAGQTAHQLRRIEVLATEDPIAFVHPLVRRSVYGAIPETERQSAHRTAARLLEQSGQSIETVAAQLRPVTPSGDAAVATTLAAAAEEALLRAAPDEAAAWLQRALEEGAAEPPRPGLLSRLGTVKTILRDPEAIGLLREAHETAEDPALRGKTGVTLAEVLSETGQWAAAHTVIEAVDRDLDGAGPELRAEAAAIRGVITLYDPALIADFDLRRRDYEQLSRGDFWASHALAVLLAVEAARRGRRAEALELCERALAGGRLLSERGAGAWTAPQLVSVYLEAEDFESAFAVIDQVDAAARASGSAFALLSVVALRGWTAALRGDLAAAEAELEAGFEAAGQMGIVMGITTLSFWLLDVLLERGASEQIAELVEQIELGPDFLGTASGAMFLEARGSLRLRHRERERGIADLRAAGRINSALRFGPTFSTWRSRLALALPITGCDEALALAREELDLARATGLARPHGIALRTLGILEDPAAGLDLLRESVALLAESPARLEHARSLVELGAALRRGNRRTEARQPLAAGLELAHACGATRLTERARQELQAGGGRRPRIYRRGRDSLTASELRVAQLAAGGATNTQIAQQLFVSLKTVETHLSRAYSKLGLAGAGSRARLAEVLGDGRATRDAPLWPSRPAPNAL